jgi:hypothetical protein
MVEREVKIDEIDNHRNRFAFSDSLSNFFGLCDINGNVK